jgi:hypothetical protein
LPEGFDLTLVFFEKPQPGPDGVVGRSVPAGTDEFADEDGLVVVQAYGSSLTHRRSRPVQPP